MEPYAILAPVILSFLILAMSSGMRYPYALFVTLLIIVLTSVPALQVLQHPGEDPLVFRIAARDNILEFTLDSLSAFFILVTNFTMLTGMLYSRGYLRPYQKDKSDARFSLHYFCYVWLHLSMLAVLMLRDGLSFLIAWELMAVSSFMLILFEAEIRSTLKTAVNYLLQMHIGLVLLTIGFLVVEDHTGLFGFEGLKPWFAEHANIPLFLLFFAGFAIKAGFIPFHTWLPSAHPAAPSHVSGVMSGVMIKMGIFGIIRVMAALQQDLFIIGIIILIISLFTGFYGILSAVVQTDLKKMLAYSTIENVGIIGTGLGLGVIGLGTGNQTLLFLGAGGALFHLMNHSLFKSLLFYGAGSVYTATHNRNMDQLGGLINKMPVTGFFFLFGSVAICALPPLNGFISELLIYYGLFSGLQTGSVYQAILLMVGLIAVVLIGGIAIYAFSKAFGITFLGTARSRLHIDAGAITPAMMFPKVLISLVILTIGLLPSLFLEPIMAVTGALFHASPGPVATKLTHTLTMISLMGLLLIILSGLLYLIRMRLTAASASGIEPGAKVRTGPTWGCGYTSPSPRQQYTGTSWAASLGELAGPVLSERVEFQKIPEDEVFPSARQMDRQHHDFFHTVTGKISEFSTYILKWIARLQTGNIQHYILYAFLFILGIFILLYLNIL